MVVPASFVSFTESSRAAFLLASNTIKGIGLVPLSAAMRALASIIYIQLLLAQVASVVQAREEVLDSQSGGRRMKCESVKPFQHEDPTRIASGPINVLGRVTRVIHSKDELQLVKHWTVCIRPQKAFITKQAVGNIVVERGSEKCKAQFVPDGICAAH